VLRRRLTHTILLMARLAAAIISIVAAPPIEWARGQFKSPLHMLGEWLAAICWSQSIPVLQSLPCTGLLRCRKLGSDAMYTLFRPNSAIILLPRDVGSWDLTR